MKIIIANKFHYLKGGADRYALDLAALLEKNGHQTAPFAMRDGQNRESSWSRYFVSPVATDAPVLSWAGLKTAGRFLYSFEARRKFADLAADFRPDILHIHNIYHQLSPSFLPLAKKIGLPVVMTAHDYKLIAPNYSLFHNGTVCEITKPHRFWRAVSHGCIRGSAAAGVLEAIEMGLHRHLGLYLKNIDKVIAPSVFLRDKFIEYGWPAERLVHVPHFVETAGRESAAGGDYFLFVGRLSAEKGIPTLLRAAAKLKDIPFRLVGTGPEESRLFSLAKELGAANVEFRGFRDGAALAAEYRGARAVVVPSVWYEVFGLVALEAAAYGKPVVASRIGGLPEVVREGETGYLFPVGDADALAERLQKLWNNPDLSSKLGQKARQIVEQDFSPQAHYRRLFEIYNSRQLKN